MLKQFTLILVMVILTTSANAQITAQQAIIDMGRGINMGNTLDAPQEGAWAGAAQEFYFDMYKDAGFKTIRIPITWDQHFGTTAPYTIDPTFLNRVEKIVDWGLSRGLFVIINAHHDDWIKNNYQTQKSRFDALWTQIADRFKNKSEKLLFEILNEPHGTITASQVDDLNARVLGIMRVTNPTRVVIYSGAGYANSPDLLNAAIPNKNDAYLMGYYHSYDPWSFAGESKGTWGTASDVQAMINKMKGVQTWSQQHNIPVLIGEFGAMFDCDYNSRMLYYATYTEQALAYGFAFTVWDDDGWFQILNRTKKTWGDQKDILIYTSDSSITNLKTQMVEDTAIQISWTNRAKTNLVEKVLIEKRTSNTAFTKVAELSPSSTIYVDRDAVEGEFGYYRTLDVYTNGIDTIPSYPIRAIRPNTKRSAYSGTPIAIPGKIEAENFDIGGELLTYHDTEPANQGGAYRLNDGVDIEVRPNGYQVGYLEVGEWLEYTIDVAKAGNYLITAYMASQNGGGKIQLVFPNVTSQEITAPKTNDWTTLQTATTNVVLEQGVQIVRLKINSTPAFNIDKLVFSESTLASIIDNEVAGLTIFPNPTSQQLEINLAGQKIENVSFYNNTGQLILRKTIDARKAIIDVSGFKTGIYLTVIKSNNTFIKARFIKE